MLYSAVLDACVLVPSHLRHVLLRIAAEGLYRPLWTERIWAEAREAVRENKPLAALEAFDGHEPKIRATFDDAMVSGWEPLEAAMLNHAKDRHVLAAAVASGADAIVSDNTRDFPPVALAPYGLECQSADVFLTNQLDLAPDSVAQAVEACAATTGKYGHPKLGPREWLDYLDNSAPTFATEARRLW